jgi:large subunit ribosomal protein L10
VRGIDWKSGEVETIAALAKGNPVVGVASIHEIPAKQFQSIRGELRGKVSIRVSKKTLVKQAFEKSGKKDLAKLEPSMAGEVALLFTDINSFKLFRQLEDQKVTSRAKPGHRPPEDVWVQKGETPFSPGPIVSQLQKVGIPARIERGKVVILKDTLFVKAGEVIDRARCDILADLGIEPMRIGLDVSAIFEDGMVFDRSVLDVDEEEMRGQMSLAAQQAFNLAFNAGFFTGVTMVPMLQDAHLKAKSLSLAAGIPTPETIQDLLAIAHSGMIGLAATLAGKNPDAVGEDLGGMISSTVPPGNQERKEDKGEEPPSEAPKEEEEKEEESVGLGALFGG